MKLDDGRLTFVAQQEVTALDAIHKAVLGKAACAGRVTEGVGTCISIHAPTWGATSRPRSRRSRASNFNPRTHVGCDAALRLFNVQLRNFNPRTHVGCDGCAYEEFCDRRNFNPRTHVGCDWRQSCIRHPWCDFNPRTHVGCDRRRLRRRRLRRNFNPRTHVGCDLCTPTLMSKINISIHAPTWGATLMVLICSHFVKISIHAPTWGATYHKDCSVQCGEYFNPRTHVGCDAAANASDITKLKFQSTHPRGVRLRINPGRTRNINFNPRTHVGCDFNTLTFFDGKIFQSTHPRGVRQASAS